MCSWLAAPCSVCGKRHMRLRMRGRFTVNAQRLNAKRFGPPARHVRGLRVAADPGFQTRRMRQQMRMAPRTRPRWQEVRGVDHHASLRDRVRDRVRLAICRLPIVDVQRVLQENVHSSVCVGGQLRGCTAWTDLPRESGGSGLMCVHLGTEIQVGLRAAHTLRTQGGVVRAHGRGVSDMPFVKQLLGCCCIWVFHRCAAALPVCVACQCRRGRVGRPLPAAVIGTQRGRPRCRGLRN